jgi:histidine decarboxylase
MHQRWQVGHAKDTFIVSSEHSSCSEFLGCPWCVHHLPCQTLFAIRYIASTPGFPIAAAATSNIMTVPESILRLQMSKFWEPASDEHMILMMRQLLTQLFEKRNNLLGYPITVGDVDFKFHARHPGRKDCKLLHKDVSAVRDDELYDTILRFLMINIGDPETSKFRGPNCYAIERELCRFAQALLDCRENKEYKSFVVPGGTESNSTAVLYGRNLFPRSKYFFPSASHYSVSKGGETTGLPESSRIAVACHDGVMDLVDLESKIRQHARQEDGIILALDAGNTVHGANDDIAGALAVCDAMGFPAARRFVHVDAAFNVFSLNLCPETKDSHRVSFTLHEIDSTTLSGHKWPGMATPCAVFTCVRTKAIKGHQIDYVDLTDISISGTRDGQSIFKLWYIMLMTGLSGYSREVMECNKVAQNLLKAIRQEHSGSSPEDVKLHPQSTTIFFPSLGKTLNEQFCLAVDKSTAHIIVTPGTSKKALEAFPRAYGEACRKQKLINGEACRNQDLIKAVNAGASVGMADDVEAVVGQ